MREYENNSQLDDSAASANDSAIFIVESDNYFKETWNYGVYRTYCILTDIKSQIPNLGEQSANLD